MSKVFKNKQIQKSLLSMVYSAQQGEHSASWGGVGEQTGMRQRPDCRAEEAVPKGARSIH